MSDVLKELAATIAARRSATGETSYTKSLLEKGALKCAEKLGEEAIETVIAAVAQDDAALVAEAADLIFHLLVVLEARGVPFDSVLNELASRVGTSGHVEKAARPQKQ